MSSGPRISDNFFSFDSTFLSMVCIYMCVYVFMQGEAR